jgi:hypothetical protein
MFECDHYRKSEEERTIAYKASAINPRYSPVKMTSLDMPIVLARFLSSKTSHIEDRSQKTPDFSAAFPGC